MTGGGPNQGQCLHLKAAGAGGSWAEASLSMEFQDRVLKCVDCGADFVFTAGEQLFFHDKQSKNEPKRCKTCKAKRTGQGGAARYSSDGGGNYAQGEHRISCRARAT